jgi:hypothetical protein
MLACNKQLSLLAVLGVTFCTAAPAVAVTYDVAKDFSIANPNGVWSYGYTGPGNTKTLYGNYSLNAFGNRVELIYESGALYVGHNPHSYSQTTPDFITFPADSFFLHPFDRVFTSYVKWTAPTTGWYQVDATFSGFTSTNATSVYIYTSDSLSFSQSVFAHSSVNFSSAPTLIENGSSVLFKVGTYNSVGSIYDITGLDAVIRSVTQPVPEPETYAMMLAGLGFLTALARRRRAKHVMPTFS